MIYYSRERGRVLYCCYGTQIPIYENLKVVLSLFLLNYTFCECSYCGFSFIVIDRLENFVPTICQYLIFSRGVHSLKFIYEYVIV